MSETNLELLARGWDAGYEAAANLLEAGIFRLIAEGPKALESMKRPDNPYRPASSEREGQR